MIATETYSVFRLKILPCGSMLFFFYHCPFKMILGYKLVAVCVINAYCKLFAVIFLFLKHSLVEISQILLYNDPVCTIGPCDLY